MVELSTSMKYVGVLMKSQPIFFFKHFHLEISNPYFLLAFSQSYGERDNKV